MTLPHLCYGYGHPEGVSGGAMPLYHPAELSRLGFPEWLKEVRESCEPELHFPSLLLFLIFAVYKLH
jgi:hypothetical protein